MSAAFQNNRVLIIFFNFQKEITVKTKSGISIPAILAKALTEKIGMLELWGELRPSCQKRHVEYVSEAVKLETRQRRIETVLRMTADYHKKHAAKSPGC